MPVVNIGGYAIHVPYHLTWQHEHVDIDVHDQRWHTSTNLIEVEQWLRAMSPDVFAQK
jgi:putative hydrolase of the HAD superfamily